MERFITTFSDRFIKFVAFGLFGFLLLFVAQWSPVLFTLVICYPIGRVFWPLLGGRAIARRFGSFSFADFIKKRAQHN